MNTTSAWLVFECALCARLNNWELEKVCIWAGKNGEPKGKSKVLQKDKTYMCMQQQLQFTHTMHAAKGPVCVYRTLERNNFWYLTHLKYFLCIIAWFDRIFVLDVLRSYKLFSFIPENKDESLQWEMQTSLMKRKKRNKTNLHFTWSCRLLIVV